LGSARDQWFIWQRLGKTFSRTGQQRIIHLWRVVKAAIKPNVVFTGDVAKQPISQDEECG
jgi:hypothetical protein